MKTGTYYLNNSGSRWVTYNQDGKKDQIIIITPEGNKERRTVIFYESFGNFASATISYKGKRMSVLMDERDEETGLGVVNIAYWQQLQKESEEKNLNSI